MNDNDFPFWMTAENIKLLWNYFLCPLEKVKQIKNVCELIHGA